MSLEYIFIQTATRSSGPPAGNRSSPVCFGRQDVVRVGSLVGTGRFELPTCRLGGGRSIHLSYVPTRTYCTRRRRLGTDLGVPRPALGRVDTRVCPQVSDSVSPPSRPFRDPAVPHVDRGIAVSRGFGIVRNHQNRLPQPPVQIAQNL